MHAGQRRAGVRRRHACRARSGRRRARRCRHRPPLPQRRHRGRDRIHRRRQGRLRRTRRQAARGRAPERRDACARRRARRPSSRGRAARLDPRGDRVLPARRADPGLPGGVGYALPEDVALLASNESPDPPLPQVVEAVGASLGGANRYPDPTNAALRGALSRPLRRARQPDRDRQRLLRRLLAPARRCSSRAPSSSTRGPRSASTRTWRRRPARPAITVPLDDEHRHDLEAMRARSRSPRGW